MMSSVVKAFLLEIKAYLRANLFQISTEFAAFLCFIVMLVAIMLYPADPASMLPLKGLAHVPAALGEVINFKSLSITEKPHYRTFESAEHNNYIIVAVILGGGIASIVLKKYFFQFFLAVFTILPWRKFGYDFQFISALFIPYCGFLIYLLLKKLVQLEVLVYILGRKIFLPFFIIPGALILPNLNPWIFTPSNKSHYMRLESSSQYSNSLKPTFDRVSRDPVTHDMTSRPLSETSQAKTTLSPNIQAIANAPVKTREQQQARAYFMAQYAAINGDAAGAASWLKRLPSVLDLTDSVVAERLAIVERYTVSQGLAGQEARQNLYRQYQNDHFRNIIIAIAASIFALIFSYIVPITNYIRKMRQERTISGRRDSNTAALLSKSNRAREALIQYDNLSKIRNNETELKGVNEKLILQAYLSLACFGVALFCFTYYMILYLPPEYSNVAFKSVSIPASAYFYWGLDFSTQRNEGDIFNELFMFNLKTFLIPILGIVIFIIPFPNKIKLPIRWLLKNTRIALYGGVGVFFTYYAQTIAFVPEYTNNLSPSKFTTELRNDLVTIAAKSGTTTRPIEASAAAYALAQIAYIEGSAARAGLFLDKVSLLKEHSYGIDLQRLEIIKEWTASQNVKTSIIIPESTDFSIRTLRNLSFYALMATIISSFVLFITALFMHEGYQQRKNLVNKIENVATSQ